MKVLIVYGTTEGQTRKIAGHIAQHLRDLAHEVRLHEATASADGLDVAEFDAVFVVASIHEETHLEAVTLFVIGHLAQLEGKPALFLSVSLSAAFPERLPEAQSYVDRFLDDTGWQPTKTHLIAGALRYSEYDYYERQIVRQGVLGDREVADPRGDLELTDWDRLLRDVDAFMTEVAA